jgi:hypothetical protein
MGGVRGVGATYYSRQILDLTLRYSAALSQNLGGPASKNLAAGRFENLRPVINH